MRKFVVSSLVFLLLLCSWSNAHAEPLGAPPLNPISNNTGINSFTQFQFFSQGEQINLTDGHLTLNPRAFKTKVYGLNITINPAFNPNRSIFGTNRFVFSEFQETEYPNLDNNDADYVYGVPMEADLGSFGHFAVERKGPWTKFALEINNDEWQFAVNDIVGMVSILLESPPQGEVQYIKKRPSYFLIKADGNVVFVSSFEKGFRSIYSIVEGTAEHVTLKDPQGNRYTFDSAEGFKSVGNQAFAQSYIEALDCYQIWFVRKCKLYLRFPGWQVRTLFLKRVEDKFGNAVDVSSLGGNNYLVKTAKTDIAVLNDDTTHKIWANYPSEENGRIWLYNMDSERRIVSSVSPEGRTTYYKYSLTDDLPQHREVGPVFSGEPSYVMEVNYPTGGVMRYEAFFDKYFKGVIVTEFPDKANPGRFFQKYVISGLSDNFGETVVYNTDGTEERYKYVNIADAYTLDNKITKFNNKTVETHYEWVTREIEVNEDDIKDEFTVIDGPSLIKDIVDSVDFTKTYTYDQYGRVVEIKDPLKNATNYTYHGGSIFIKTITKTKTRLVNSGNEVTETADSLKLTFEPFLPYSSLGGKKIQPLGDGFLTSFNDAYEAQDISGISDLIDNLCAELEEDTNPPAYLPYVVGSISLTVGEQDTYLLRKYLYNPLNGNLIRAEDGSGNGITYWYDFCSVQPGQCNGMSEEQRTALGEAYPSVMLIYKDDGMFGGGSSQTASINSLQALVSSSSTFSGESIKTTLSQLAEKQIRGTAYAWDRYLDTVVSESNHRLVKVDYQHNKDGQLLGANFPISSSYISHDYDLTDQGNNKITTALYDGTRGRNYTRVMDMDGLGFITKELATNGDTKYITYGSNKRIQSIKNSSGRTVQYLYDGVGRVVAVFYPGGESVLLSYSRKNMDHFGKNIPVDVIYTIRGGSVYLTWYRDSNGKIVGIDQNAIGAEYRYRYDELGNLIETKSPEGLEIKNIYDSLSRLSERLYPDGSSFEMTSFSPGNLGFPKEVKVGSGNNPIIYSLISDSYGRLTNVSKQGVAGNLFEVTYDQFNDPDNAQMLHNGYDRLTAIDDRTGKTKYYYDVNDRIVGVARTIDDISSGVYYIMAKIDDAFGNPYKLKYPRLPDGSLENLPDGMTIPQGPALNYDVDGKGRLKSVINEGDGKALTTYAYDDAGNLSTVNYSNGVNANYTYHSSGRIKSILISNGEAKLSEEHYFYDSFGNLAELRFLDGSKVEYTYDNNGRPIEVAYTKSGEEQAYFTQKYKYDEDGNITEYSDDNQTVEYVIHNSSEKNISNRLVQSSSAGNVSVVEYTYDDMGNLTQEKHLKNGKEDSIRTFNYNSLNQLISASVNDSTAGYKTNTQYKYDHLGRRQSKTFDGKTKYYIYGEDNVPFVELNSYGVPETFHIYAGGHRIATYKEGVIRHYHVDPMGNTRLVTDENGEVVQRVYYDIFGNHTLKWGMESNDYLYGEMELDNETGLIYFGGNYYNPRLGKFISKNKHCDGSNLYSILDQQNHTDKSLLNAVLGIDELNSKQVSIPGKYGGVDFSTSFVTTNDYIAPKGKSWLERKFGKLIEKGKDRVTQEGDPNSADGIPVYRTSFGTEKFSFNLILTEGQWKKVLNALKRAGRWLFGIGGPKFRELDHTAQGFDHIATASPKNNILQLDPEIFIGLNEMFSTSHAAARNNAIMLSEFGLVPSLNQAFSWSGDFGLRRLIQLPIYQFNNLDRFNGGASALATQYYDIVP